MKTKVALVLAAYLVLSVDAVASDAKTDGMANGRFWMMFGDSERLIYLLGFTDGRIMTKPTDRDPLYECGSNMGEIMKGITNFFDDPANARVLVSHAYRWHCMRVSGKDDAELQKFVSFARSVAAAAAAAEEKR